MFTIAALEILESCSSDIRKVLKPSIYVFNDRVKVVENEDGEYKVVSNDNHLSDTFYTNNINIQALVGKNGSGKSSLLDIIYRIANNIGALASWRLLPVKDKQVLPSYVKGIHAKLYYTQDDKLYWILCREDTLIIHTDKEYNISENTNASLSDDNLREILEYLFYTIVTNYSVQSFISRDYEDEKCDWKEDKDGKRLSVFGEPTDWLNYIFHKNDGYLSPIVLNPYRYDGAINMNTEEELTEERLTSLLLFDNKNNGIRLLPGYRLDKVSFWPDMTKLFNKYIEAIKILGERENEGGIQPSTHSAQTIPNSQKWKEHGDFIKDFQSLVLDNHERTYTWEILQNYDIVDNILHGNDLVWWAAAYIVYKTLNIASRYPSYSDFKDIGGLWKYELVPNDDEQKLLKQLVNKITGEDSSHITLKVRQALNFIKEAKINGNNNKLLGEFDYDSYLHCLNIINKPQTLNDLFQYLPPAIFKREINLMEDGISRKFEKLSSGERQLVYTVSTVLYHIENILSINEKDKSRVKYHNVNVVMDEVEITFHPDMQRKFINNLVQLLEDLDIPNRCGVNIIIATHSPFVLSDIPEQNILYLENGSPKRDIQLSPFAANVNEVLAQSFFLDNGFMGEFAQNKIDKVIDIIQTADKPLSDKQSKEIEQVIECIGEPLLKQSITNLYMNNRNPYVNLQRRKKWLEEQLKQVNKKIEDE